MKSVHFVLEIREETFTVKVNYSFQERGSAFQSYKLPMGRFIQLYRYNFSTYL